MRNAIKGSYNDIKEDQTMELSEKELNEMKIDGEDFSEEFFAEHDDSYVNDEEDENDE